MKLLRRMGAIFQAKATAAMDAAENPIEMAKLALEKMNGQVQELRRAIVAVMTSRKQIEMQISSLDQKIAERDTQAKSAIAQNRPDLAKAAVQQKLALVAQEQPIHSQLAELSENESRLRASQTSLEAKIAAFRTQSVTMEASYRASFAQSNVIESLAGLSEEMGSVGNMMERAQAKVSKMSVHAAALDSYMESIDQISGTTKDPIQLELDKLSATSEVDAEMARLTNEVAGPTLQISHQSETPMIPSTVSKESRS